MSTAAVTGAAAANAEVSKAASSRATLAQNMDTFLTMLTTQLKNQDPLSPMDSTEFTNQLVQFAGVEQQINGNASLEKLVAMNRANQMIGSVGYMGKTIQASSNYLPLQDKKAEFAYTTPKGADKVAIVIYNDKGQPVRTLEGKVAVGTHTESWDGKDASGKQLDDGAYKIEVKALKGEEKTELEVAVTGTVTGVASADNKTYLTLGGVQVTLDQVLTIKEKAAPVASAPPASTTPSDDASENTETTQS